ncbi:chromosome partitioning protein ParA [Candidatus Accumulibacter phosphatis]|uniref:Chromosome partitioning protein ParA n=1 Tax=Candidatus Accumulibacter contiguus TaxID=2954381 RepID=A0ABX1TAY5_9PROT|nr:AAA family ATPase [Candidatus Accumulibacter contiguus]NMQ06833.1 chromosome partitioning protein ParA [Candidatus Accumulibacter contiguus]
MAIKVSVINFKGGVGKSTLTFHLAAHLAASSKVLVVDVDHQSSLSIVMMGGALWDKAAIARTTCNTIFESFCNRKVKMPGTEIIHKNILHSRSPKYDLFPNLDLVPAQFELDDTEIEMASTTMGSAMLSEWHKRTLMAEWLDNVRADSNYDYIVFDCPPATKLVSQNALAASNYFLIPVIPDAMSSRGVTHFRTLVTNKIDKKLDFLRTGSSVADKDVPGAYCPKTKMAAIVPFMAKTAGNAASGLTNIHTEQLAALRRQWGDEMIKPVVKHMTGVAEAIDAGWPVWTAYETQNIKKVIPMMKSTCEAIAKRLLP